MDFILIEKENVDLQKAETQTQKNAIWLIKAYTGFYPMNLVVSYDKYSSSFDVSITT